MRTIPVTLVAALTLSACSASPNLRSEEPSPTPACALTVGVVELSDGVVASMGESARDGFTEWVEQVTEEGGAHEHPVAVVSRSVATPAQAGEAARQLVEQGVSVVVTPISSDASVAAGKVAVPAGVPAISWAGTSPTIVESVGPGMFSNGHSDRAQGEALARFARTQGYGRALTLRGPDTLFTDQLPRYFSEPFTAAGGTVVGEETYRTGDTDFGPVVTRLRSGEADVLVTAAYGPELVALLRQLRAAGVTVPVLGADGAEDPVIVALPEAEGFAYTTYVVRDQARADAMLASVTRRSGEPAFPVWSVLGYELGLVLDDAVSRAASCAPADMKDAIAATKGVRGLTGTITFAGGDGMAIREMPVVRVSGGRAVPVA